MIVRHGAQGGGSSLFQKVRPEPERSHGSRTSGWYVPKCTAWPQVACTRSTRHSLGASPSCRSLRSASPVPPAERSPRYRHCRRSSSMPMLAIVWSLAVVGIHPRVPPLAPCRRSCSVQLELRRRVSLDRCAVRYASPSAQPHVGFGWHRRRSAQPLPKSDGMADAAHVSDLRKRWKCLFRLRKKWPQRTTSPLEFSRDRSSKTRDVPAATHGSTHQRVDGVVDPAEDLGDPVKPVVQDPLHPTLER